MEHYLGYLAYLPTCTWPELIFLLLFHVHIWRGSSYSRFFQAVAVNDVDDMFPNQCTTSLYM